MRNTASRYIMEYCRKNKNGFLIAGDAGFGVWDDFKKELPDQYLNPGINEAATIGLAAGMALRGHRVFIYNIIPFLMMRCYEQVRLDICYQNLPVVFIGIGSGITYAPAGMTHYSVEDIAIAATFPNINIISPSDPNQVNKALEYAVLAETPTYIRVSKAGEPNITSTDADISSLCCIRKTGSRKAVIFHGSISDAVISAGESADFDIYTLPMLQPLDSAGVQAVYEQYEKIFIAEEHFGYGGLYTMLKHVLPDSAKLQSLAIRNEYIHKIGNRDHLRRYYGIDAESIAARINGE